MKRLAFRPGSVLVLIALFLSSIVLVHPTISSFASGTTITLTPTFGPPTSTVRVKGTGFNGGESVLLTFDTTQLKSVTASSTGTLSTSIIISKSALPGNHVIQAKGKSSGRIAQATFLVQTDWVQQGFNRQHTSFNVFENVLNTGNVSSLTQSWAYLIYNLNGSVVVAGGVLYFGCYQTYVCALSSTTGQLLWSHNLNDTIAALPAVATNLVYMNTTGGHVVALNATTGQLVWSYATGFSISEAPLTANGLVYSGASNGVLYTFNGTTGQVVWKHSFPGVFSTPTIDGGLLYLSAGGSLYALNSKTGQTSWHVLATGGTPVIANGMIYLSDNADGKFMALNEKTGVLVWSNPSYASAPAVANGIVYIQTARCTIDAVSATTGAVLWQYNSYLDSTCIYGNPIVANGVVYIASTDDEDPDCYCTAVYALAATNGVLDGYVENDDGDWLNGSYPIVVVNGTVYYSAVGNVYAYRLPGSA